MSDERPYVQFTDDELLETGTQFEARLIQLRVELGSIQASANSSRANFRKAITKLGINAGLAGAGIFASPVTLGVSLLLTIGGFGMLAWDTLEIVQDRKRMAGEIGNLQRMRKELAAMEEQQRYLLDELIRRTE